MKINDKHCYKVLENNKEFFAKAFTDAEKEEIDKYPDSPYISVVDYNIEQLLDVNDKTKYIFSKPVIDTLQTIRIKDSFDCNILLSRKTQSGIIVINEKELFAFGYYGLKLRVFHLDLTKTKKENMIWMSVFSFDLINNKTIASNNVSEFEWKNFLRCIIYLDFLPITTQNIKPSGRFGNHKEGKVLNESDASFVFVSKAWNQEYETLPGVKYLCRAHWGIRWTGKGRTVPKLVFVKSSLKEMHKRPLRELYQ